MAMYQAAVSKVESSSSFANASEETESCTVPGGLARVKKQFEKGQMTSAQNAFAQYQHKSVQEMSSSSQRTVSSSHRETEGNEITSKESHMETLQTEEISHREQITHERKEVSTVLQHNDETVVNAAMNEEFPKISTQVLKQQFEKTAREKAVHSDKETATPAKQAKIENGYQEAIWPSAVSCSSTTTTSASRLHETSTARRKQYGTIASAMPNTRSPKYGNTENFPATFTPAPLETTEISQSPEQPTSPKSTIPKDLYSKQRNLYELKRLYKHIHPELRKSLEKDYLNEISDILSSESEARNITSGDVQQARYVFENTIIPQKFTGSEKEYIEWDEILKGEVQSMRWIFENQPLDSIKDDSPDPDNVKSIAEQEIIAGGDVKYTTWMFETQPIQALGAQSSESAETTDKIPELARGDVRTATWMFETQPLDSMNKIYHDEEQTSDETCVREISGGDVKTVKYMFETQNLDKLGQLYSVDEVNLLQLRSELKEIKGNVKRSIKHFETRPLYVIRDNLGQILEIKTVHREDIEKGDVRTARWMFETQPLDRINKDPVEIKVLRGISMEENVKGGVHKAKWLFETQPLDTIKEDSEEMITQKETILGTDVSRKCWIFETQPLDTLKENDDASRPLPEEIIGGDVSGTKHLFETLPMDALKDSLDVGKLQKVVATEEEKGDVRHQKWVFETKPLEQIREERKEFVRTVKLEEIDRGDVNAYKNIFESSNLKKYDKSQRIHVEGVIRGAVELNKALFETTPLYAIQDSHGKYHEVKTIRQEEILRGDVRSCRWLFETRPLDQFDESDKKIQIIKGISSQEVISGDVKTAKWLFETQPLDAIKHFSDMGEEEIKAEQRIDIVKGDVKTCRWLFETQPMESLYDKVEVVTDSEEIHKGDVKTCTQLFETQPLDAIKDGSEITEKLHTVNREDIHGSDVRTACCLFETENLENIQGEEGKELKRIMEIDIQPGDVSTMKQKFENHSLDSINFSSEEVLEKIKTIQKQEIQKGNVLHCRWLFENHSIDDIKENQENSASVKTVTDIKGGNVRKSCFIFETFSLDQIRDESENISTKKTISEEEITKGNVKNYRMMFENQSLYAIQDKEGNYHEVTTVKKEDVIHGDVRGTRWLFETKPLDSINESDNVYIIRAVTQEDIQKGDVSSVRYRFETQPLDKISENEKIIVPAICSVVGADVKANKRLFESEELSKGTYVRTVSVSEVQHGNVKTATWLFETHTLDEIRAEGSEYKDVQTVTKEDVQEGDVQHAVWVFENQPLDSIKETDESEVRTSREDIPQVDVKTTTWLFETTPFHEFNESKVEKQEIIGKSIKETLKELYSQKVVESHGIIIASDEIGDVRMAKYKLMNQKAPEIQKEEIIKGDLGNIMMNLLSIKNTTKKEIVVNDDEKGNVNLTKTQLLNRSVDDHVEKEEIVRGDIQQAIKKLFSKDSSVKQGILIQENERGDVNMTIYSLLHKKDGRKMRRDEVIGGDVKRTIHSLLSSIANNEIPERAKIEENERGNVQFFTTCIEAGALDYLKLFQTGSDETSTNEKQEEDEEIIAGDVEGTKLLLKKHKSPIQRTVAEADIIPGDVCNAVKSFTAEPQDTSSHIQKEEIIKGDLKAALNSLSQAISQTTVKEKEEIIKADILAILKSLEEAAFQLKEAERPEVIPGDIKRTIESLEKAINAKIKVLKTDVVQEDLDSTLRSLKEAQLSFKSIGRGDVINRDTQTVVQNELEICAERKMVQSGERNQTDIKGTAKPAFKPSQQLAHGNMTQNQAKSVKSHHECYQQVQAKNETFLKEAAKVTEKIHLDQSTESPDIYHIKKMNLPNLQQKSTEKVEESKDKTRVQHKAENDTKSPTEQHMKNQSTFCEKVGRNHVAKSKIQQSQDRRETFAIKEMNPDQVQDVVTRTAGQSVKDEVTQETHSNFKETESRKRIDIHQQNKKLVGQFTRKTKIEATKSDARLSVKAPSNPAKNVIQKDTTEMDSLFPPPPSLPPSPPPSVTSSEGEFPLPPPPPPPLTSDKQMSLSPPLSRETAEFDHFPPPPPPLPIDDKSESEFLSGLPLPPPPPHLLIPPTMQPRQNKKHVPKYPEESLLHPEQIHASTEVAGKSTAVASSQNHARREPTRGPEGLKSKIPPIFEPTVLHMRTETDITKILADSSKSETLMNVVSHKQKQVSSHTRAEEGGLLSSAAEMADYSPKAQEEILSVQKKETFPVMKSPSVPSENEAQIKPKPYIRKFVTPLMIAEEKYRQQKEEREKTEVKICCESVRTSNKVQGSPNETLLQKPNKQDQGPAQGAEAPGIPEKSTISDSDIHVNFQARGFRGDKKLSASSTTKQLQEVLEASEENHSSKKVLLGAKHNLSCQMEKTHPDQTLPKPEQLKNVEQLTQPQNKISPPTFKVKTIKVPIGEQSLQETHKDSEIQQNEIRAEGSEYKDVQTVTKEDVQEGDVQHAVWVFENQPLDSIKETDESEVRTSREDIPQVDVKTTTWLFETTPFHEFNESKVEKQEIIGKSIKETLKELYSQKVVESHGIIIASDEIGDVRMAKYKLMNQKAPEIQKEEIIKGDLGNIMMNLLSIKNTTKKEIVVNDDEKGNVNLTKTQLLNRSVDDHVEKEEIVRGDIQQAIKKLFSKDSSVKQGILIQENERGDVNMTIYSLLHKKDGRKMRRDEVIGGDVKRTIHSLLSSIANNEIPERAKIEENERGNVQFFTTCIEAGALDYLKLFQTGSDETSTNEKQEEDEEIIAGDVEGTKLLLKKHKSPIQRTVAEADIIPGDVCNAVKSFTAEPQDTSSHIQKEEIIKGDLKAALNSLSQAISQTTVKEKEEIIKADILAILKSLEEAAFQLKEAERPEVIPGDIKRTIESLEKAINAKIKVLKTDVVQEDLDSTLRSLKEAQLSFKSIGRGDVINRDTQTVVQNELEICAERKMVQSGERNQTDIKGTAKPAFKPSQQLAHGNMTQNQAKSVKSHHECYQQVQAKNETFLKEAAKVTEKIHLDQSTESPDIYHIKKMNLPNLQQKSTEKVEESKDKTRVQHKAENDTKSPTEQHMKNQSTFCEKVGRNVRAEKSETYKALKTNMCDHFQKHVAKSKIQQSQDRRETFAIKEMNPDQVQDVVTRTAGQSVKDEVTQETHSNFKETESRKRIDIHQQNKKLVGQFTRKTKIEATKSDARLSVKAPPNQAKNVIQKDTTEMDSLFPPPPSLPPSPPPSVTSSEGEFPLPPPPPPPLTSDKQMSLSPAIIIAINNSHTINNNSNSHSYNVNFYFFPPPLPIDDKSESEFLSGLPLPPPPPHLLIPPTMQPRQKKKHVPKYPEESLLHPEQIHASTEVAGKSTAVASSQNHARREPTRGPEGLKSKIPPKFEPTVLHMRTETDITKILADSSKSETLMNVVSHKQKQVSSHTRAEEGGLLSSATEMADYSPKAQEEILSVQKKETFPVMKSPSVPSENEAQIKPKPYIRKFVTPLMIAEEKYRQQKEEREKTEVKICCESVRTSNKVQGSPNETLLQKPNKQDQGPAQGAEAPGIPEKSTISDSDIHVNFQARGFRGDKKLSASSTTKQLQEVLEASEENHSSKKVLLGAKHNLSCQMEKTHPDQTLPKPEQLKNVEQLTQPQNKISPPTFKVKTIKVPIGEQSLQETHKESEIQVQKTSASQEYNRLQENACVKHKGIQVKASLLKKKDPKQENTHKNSLCSSPLHTEEKCAVDIVDILRKREELQEVLCRVKQFEDEPNRIGLKTFKTFLNIIPVWLIDQERKKYIAHIITENNAEKMKEELSDIKYQASQMLASYEDSIQTAVSSRTVKSRNNSTTYQGTSQKISGITTGSNKKDLHKTTGSIEAEAVHQDAQQQSNGLGQTESRSSPALRMRSPSPTYITIESRRTDSPLREAPSSPTQREGTSFPLPPHRSATSKTKIRQPQSSPSSRSQAEQLAKLKDTTAKLSQGATQHQAVNPLPIVEKRSEIIKSPATLRRQIKIEMHARKPLSSVMPPVYESQVTAGTVKNTQETQEKRLHALHAEKNKYLCQDRLNIPEHLESQSESLDSISVTRKFESPGIHHPSGLIHRFEASEIVTHTKNEPTTVVERLHNESAYEKGKLFGKTEDKDIFEVKSMERDFRSGEVNSKIKDRTHIFNRDEFCMDNQSQKANFQNSSCWQLRETKQDISYKPGQRKDKEQSFQPAIRLEAKSHNECSSDRDTLTSTVVESRTATSASQNVDSMQSGFGFKHAPPTYEDVISGHILDISTTGSPEELLKNFQKTWQESEQVFKSLGYSVSDTSETEMRSSFHEEAEYFSETTASGTGNMHTLSTASLPNGMPSRRQAEFS
ncbi:PREDICTED: xin actin-binding repeat-containing protein 2 [Tinamus guttatus]|uniref:xin actin-binding repeat-containing protein 2 n=1 Tax=Tinamus guttatus TaxID=94827 RepID=UPI00052F1E23|nr:PREDICTED: xin actin-binding repeat-containing protein 2 [Tinamus guttatus]